jgi:hypothetical protein
VTRGSVNKINGGKQRNVSEWRRESDWVAAAATEPGQRPGKARIRRWAPGPTGAYTSIALGETVAGPLNTADETAPGPRIRRAKR